MNCCVFLLNIIGYFISCTFVYHEETLCFVKKIFTRVTIIDEKLDQILYIIK